MRKTTLYIEDDLIVKAKLKAIEDPSLNVTKIINDALRKYLDGGKTPKDNFKELRKALGSSKGFKKVSDPVKYQRALRSEWE